MIGITNTAGTSQGRTAHGALQYLVLSSLCKFHIKTILVERSLHFKLTQSVSESWIFVWALCKRSGGFSSLQTTSTVQAEAEKG